MAIGEQEGPELVPILDWHDLYNHTVEDNAVIADLAYRGRWTAIAAAAKAGKSTAILGLAVETTRHDMNVLYLDAEMGRVDAVERVADWMQLQPDDLKRLHYTDLPPKLDTVQGATALWHTVNKLHPDLVIIDGLNGVVNGAENEDTTWRDFYELAIAPIKQQAIAVVSLDNSGLGERKGPRGHSVKLDKADAILYLTRTDTGIKLAATHRRTASYPLEQEYLVANPSEEGPPMTITRVGVGTGTPAGTAKIVTLLDQLNAPIDISRRKARQLLVDNRHDAPRNSDLGIMLKWRRQQADPFHIDLSTGSGPGTNGDHGDHGDQPGGSGPHPRGPLHKPPASGVVPDGVSTCSTPPVGTKNLVPDSEPPKPVENPF